MDSITVEMIRVTRTVNQTPVFIYQTHITSNKVGNFSMEDITTNHRNDIWMKYSAKYKEMQRREHCPTAQLNEKELREIIKGTKLHRQLTHRKAVMDSESENSDSESDPDFIPTEAETEFSDLSDYSSEEEDTSVHNISTVSVVSTETSCIKEILRRIFKTSTSGLMKILTAYLGST